MVGIALFLSLMATTNTSASALRASYPKYEMSKNKIELHDKNQINQILEKIKMMYSMHDINTEDGVKITMKNEWVHLRRSNTEPVSYTHLDVYKRQVLMSSPNLFICTPSIVWST